MILYKIFFVLCIIFYTAYGKSILHTSNNGPSVLDGTITFDAFLEDYSHNGSLCYTFDDGIQKQTIETLKANVTFLCSFASHLYKAGTYLMTSCAIICDTNDTIATNQSRFELHEYLIGKLAVNRDTEGLDDVDEVAVGENITMAVQLYDPNGYLVGAKISYTWSIDYEPDIFMNSNISYSYSNVEVSRIVATVSAQLQNNAFKFGLFDKKLTVEVPVNSVNVSGKTFFYHGDILALDISCNGSSPFRYCARPLKRDEVAANFSCNPIISTTCKFHTEHYFRNYGNYQYGIYISNDVKTVKKVIEVLVYNRSKTPQLSTVIIPIICSLITLCIIAGGIAYYIQHHNQLSIEVANFDFQEDSVESHTSSTFFEKILQSCSCSAGVGSRGDEFVEEDEPLIASSRRKYSK